MPSFVIKAGELATLNFLDPNHPRPRKLEWINRGTDQVLQPSTVEMLLRTLFREATTPSVIRLHEWSGLRASFGAVRERDAFAAAFAAARSQEKTSEQYLATAIFDDGEAAVRAVAALKDAGVPKQGISVMWGASRFLDGDYRINAGHSVLSVAGAVAGGSVAGALLGAGVLFIPGIGPVVTGGLLAASAFSSVTTVGGMIGGTGAAIAKMLTDHDVDDVAAKAHEEKLKRGKVFVSVDVRVTERRREEALQLLEQFDGRALRYG